MQGAERPSRNGGLAGGCSVDRLGRLLKRLRSWGDMDGCFPVKTRGSLDVMARRRRPLHHHRKQRQEQGSGIDDSNGGNNQNPGDGRRDSEAITRTASIVDYLDARTPAFITS